MDLGGTQALGRAITLLSLVVEDCGARTLAQLCRVQGLPLSTGHRMVARMEAAGLLVRIGRGRYRAGLGLARLVRFADEREIAVAVARPLLRDLARRTGRTAHLGMFEADMVTYLVKEAPVRAEMFTRETMQLEAYCSAIGKVLLGQLPDAARHAYLAHDGFVALTPRTIVNGEALRLHLADVVSQGFALDEEEIAPGLYCVAVPVGAPLALAISVAGPPACVGERASILSALRSVAAVISGRLRDR